MAKKIISAQNILKLALLMSVPVCFAISNEELFNQAVNVGNQNHPGLNLNQNSTIDSYGQANNFTDAVADNANAGVVPSHDMYEGQNNNPNYLYNSGTQSIRDCENSQDPRCTTLNKYADKDTQTQLQAYTSGPSSRYQIEVEPDPINQACSIVKRKKPINETTATCISSPKQQTNCNNMLTPTTQLIPQNPSDGTVMQPDPRQVNLCNIQTVTGTTGYASDYLNNPVFFVIKMSASSFSAGQLPINLYSYNSRPNCVGSNGVILLTPTSTRIKIGESLSNLNGTYTFYQDSGSNCGTSSSTTTCHINLSVDLYSFIWNYPNLAKWTVTFSRPTLASTLIQYHYSKGCPNAN